MPACLAFTQLDQFCRDAVCNSRNQHCKMHNHAVWSTHNKLLDAQFEELAIDPDSSRMLHR